MYILAIEHKDQLPKRLLVYQKGLKGSGFWMAGRIAYLCWCRQIADAFGLCTRILMKKGTGLCSSLLH